MKPSRFAAVYSICVGAVMIIMWVFFLASGTVPEYKDRPAEITLHLLDELITATALLGCGIFALRLSKLGSVLQMVSLGMLFYTLIVSPGYYIQNGAFGFVAMFVALLILGIVAVVLQTRKVIEQISSQNR